MKITENDIDILPGCVIIETLNQERDVNKLMYIHEELALKGYLLDVWDYDYMGFFTAGLHSTTDANITNHREYKEEFIQIPTKMKKVLTITWNTDTGSMFTDWGDSVTATDVLAMCEFAEGEAEFEIEEQNNESDE